MHSQTELHGWKAKWESIYKHEWWYCQYFHHNLLVLTEDTQPLQGKHFNFEFKAVNYIKKILVSVNVLYVTLEKPLNLGNKIILEQKQDISAGI